MTQRVGETPIVPAEKVDRPAQADGGQWLRLDHVRGAAETIDAAGAPVHPGFINGHYHAGLHLSRGCITDKPQSAADEGARHLHAQCADRRGRACQRADGSNDMVKNGFPGVVEAASAFDPQAVGICCTLADCMIWDTVGGEPMAADIPRAPCGGLLRFGGEAEP